jgi:hypothetical protein
MVLVSDFGAANVKGQATTSTETVAGASFISRSKPFADQQYHRATTMKKLNPTLVTYQMIAKALEHNPSGSIIKQMLQVNPKAAGIPKSGPTPLQIAVQNNCCLEVVKLLLKSCPLALVATNPDSPTDPLTYAKKYRSHERELIKLLSLPFGHWVPAVDEQPRIEMSYRAPSPTTCGTKVTVVTPPANARAPHRSSLSPPVGLQAEKRQQAPPSNLRIGFSPDYYNELNSVQSFTASVTKGQSLFSTDLQPLQDQFMNQLREEWLVQVKAENGKLLQEQRAAMNTRQKQIKDHTKKVERRFMKALYEREAIIMSRLKIQDERLDSLTVFVEQRSNAMQSKWQDKDQHVQGCFAELLGEDLRETREVMACEPSLAESQKTPIVSNQQDQTSSPFALTVDALADPIIFCTESYSMEDDERSLLTEDEFGSRNNALGRSNHYSPTHIWSRVLLLLCKEGLVL